MEISLSEIYLSISHYQNYKNFVLDFETPLLVFRARNEKIFNKNTQSFRTNEYDNIAIQTLGTSIMYSQMSLPPFPEFRRKNNVNLNQFFIQSSLHMLYNMKVDKNTQSTRRIGPEQFFFEEHSCSINQFYLFVSIFLINYSCLYMLKTQFQGFILNFFCIFLLLLRYF